jgi:hypothetical protein
MNPRQVERPLLRLKFAPVSKPHLICWRGELVAIYPISQRENRWTILLHFSWFAYATCFGHKSQSAIKVERKFRDLDEVLIWVDRNQLGRRNLTDSQRTEVIGRIYNTLKQNPVLNLKPFQSRENGKGAEDREEKFTSLKGSDATARAVAKATGVSEKTVRNAGKFAEAVAALERISPKAAEIVLRDEVRDAKTQLPKVPEEMFSFVAKKHGLSFQIVEREFRDLDEVLIWVDRNQLGRRNLTDEQRAVVIGRLYKTVKQNPLLNLKPFQKDNSDRVLKLSTLEGSAATARAIAEQVGVGQATVRRAEKFADAVETLQEISPQAAERVLRGEVRDASPSLRQRGQTTC